MAYYVFDPETNVVRQLEAGSNVTLTEVAPDSLRIAATGGGGAGTPGGSDTQVQFNDAGSFGGDADFVYDQTTGQLRLGASTFHASRLTINFNGLATNNAYGLIVAGDAAGAATSQIGVAVFTRNTADSNIWYSYIAFTELAANVDLQTSYGLYVYDTFLNTGATLQTQYGIRVLPLTSGVENYVWWSEAGLAYFGDDVEIVNSAQLIFERDDATTDPAVRVEQAGAGDAAVRYEIGSAHSYAVGVDNSDGDAWKVSYAASAGAVLGTDDYLTISTAGQVGLPVTGAGGGLVVGGDVQWYRSAANVWFTPDSVDINTRLAVGGLGVAGLPDAGLNVFRSVTDGSNPVGLEVIVRSYNNTGAGNTVVGMSFTAATYAAASANTATEIRGLSGQVLIEAASGLTNTVASATTIRANVPSLTGLGTRVLTTLVGLLVDNHGHADASVSYGIRVQTQSGSPTSYGLVVEAGLVVFNADGTPASDFTVRSDTYEAVFVDASNDSLALMNNSAGKLAFYGQTPAVRAAAYTVTNGAADRAFDADATGLAELADVLATLIADLQTYGLLQ